MPAAAQLEQHAPAIASASSTGTAAELNRKGAELVETNHYDDAREVFERARLLAREQMDVRQEGYALLGIGNVHYRAGEYGQAGGYYDDAVARFQAASDAAGLAEAYRSRGGLDHWLGDSEKSQADYKKALAYCEQTGDQRLQAGVLLDMTFGANLSQDARTDYLRQAEEIAGRIGDQKLEAHILHNWGDDLTVQGRFAEADDKLGQAAKLMEQTGDRKALARVFTSRGRLLRLHGQPEHAIEMYRQGLVIQQQTGDLTGVIQSYNAMGVAYTALGKYGKAGECYQTALHLARSTGSPRIVDFMKGALASNYLDRREYAQAAHLLEEVVGNGKDATLDFRYVGLAKAYYELGRYADGLAAIDKAIAMQRQRQQSFTLYDTVALRASTLAKLGRIEEAIAEVHESMRLLEQQRANTLPADFLKQGYADTVQSYYSLAVKLLVQGGRGKEALAFAEQGRARAFLDLLATREAGPRQEDAAQIASLQAPRPSPRGSQAGAAGLPAGGFPQLLTRGRSSGTESEFWKMGKANELDLKSSASAEALSAGQLAATAKRLESTILSYWVTENRVYIWLVRADGTVRLATSSISRQRLNELINLADGDQHGLAARGSGGARQQADRRYVRLATRGGMKLQLNDSFRKPWRQLYQALLRPIRDELPQRPGSRLTIIPHGPLFRLSFAALLDDRGRYLIERYEIHYAPAGAVLDFTRREVATADPRSDRYLLVADPANMPAVDGDRKLPGLTGARAEVGAAARLLPAGMAAVVGGAAATESRVRAEMRAARVVHLATHGIVRDDSPLDSYLAVGVSGGSPEEDGRLTVREIYGLQLHAELVFLSACRSGRGKITGDGVMGLTRSFLYAGAPSVVATLWDVADETTARLVRDFYRGYVRHGAPGRSLRAAQLRLLADLRAGRVVVSTPVGPVKLDENPALWAAFAVVGEP